MLHVPHPAQYSGTIKYKLSCTIKSIFNNYYGSAINVMLKLALHFGNASLLTSNLTSTGLPLLLNIFKNIDYEKLKNQIRAL